MALLPMLETSSASEDDTDDLEEPIADDLIDDSDEQDDDDSDDLVDPVDPVDPATLGATFEETEDGINIQFGENETGRLAVVTFVDTQDSASDFLAEHEARYYLVPEGVEWDDNTSETQSVIPGENEWKDETDDLFPVYTLDSFEDHFDLTLLGTVDLLAAGDDSPSSRDMADSLPALTTNADDVDYYYLEENTDGQELITFLREGWLETRNGVTETEVNENTVGTEGSDWLSTSTQGVTLDGAGGDDTLDTSVAGVSFLGGDGNDDINAYTGGASIDGGAGDDTINSANADISGGDGDDSISASDSTISGGDGADNITLNGGGDNNVAYGDAGNDGLSTSATGDVTLYGGAGDDNLSAHLAGNALMAAELFGGDGNDQLNAGNGVIAYGEDGDDSFQADAGATVYGGDGDDTFRVSEMLDNEEGRITLNGGAGADVYEVAVRNPFGDPTDDVYLQIEDFDIDEDILMVGSYGNNADVSEIIILEDPNGAFTDIEVSFELLSGNVETEVATIRLVGTTGFTADLIVAL
ncbi:calcium-binding protein [Octadecabacter temperatus]|nr:calcium-binding protein [Octadecabacter temperatus]